MLGTLAKQLHREPGEGERQHGAGVWGGYRFDRLMIIWRKNARVKTVQRYFREMIKIIDL